MSDPKYKSAAVALAMIQPDIAGHSAFPPQSWWIEGEDLLVLGADGRKFRGALQGALNIASQPNKVMKLPVHKTLPGAPHAVPGAPKQPPAKSKAGK